MTFIAQDVELFHLQMLRALKHLFSILLLRVIIPKDVSSEIENCARDHLLFDSKAHIKVNSQGGLVIIIFKLPILLHSWRGEEVEEGVGLHLFGNFLGSNSTFPLLATESFHLDCSCSHILACLPIN